MRKFAVCIKNQGYEASLERWKIYPVIDEEAGLLKVIDESGEDYLYPQEMFSFIELPPGFPKRSTKNIASEKFDPEFLKNTFSRGIRWKPRRFFSSYSPSSSRILCPKRRRTFSSASFLTSRPMTLSFSHSSGFKLTK